MVYKYIMFLLIVWKPVKRSILLVLSGAIELCFHWKKDENVLYTYTDGYIRLLFIRSREVFLFMQSRYRKKLSWAKRVSVL